jgi:tight adherence protein C
MSESLGQLASGAATLIGNRSMLLGLIALAVFLFTLGIAFTMSWATDPVRRRLGSIAPGTTPAAASWPGRIKAAIEPVARYVRPTNEKERGDVEKKLAHAGFRSDTALPVFYGLKVSMALLLLVAWMIASAFLPRLTSNQVMFYSLIAAFVGLTLPSFVLNRLLERRQKALRNAFPDALDMLVVCVESGLGLNAALQRVSDELEVSHPILAAELAQVNAETRAGVEREVALRNLADRTGLDDIRGLVGLLVQTMRFGTSIADSLRVYSEEFRDKRTQKAEELAAKIGTKLIFPLVVCLFPGFFVVAIGPAILRLVEAFSKM